MKTYIKPNIKVVVLSEECLGPGAGDISNPHVGNANQGDFFDDSNMLPTDDTQESIWDAE